MPLLLTSPAFADGAPMPAVCTCEGADTSPALQFSGVPAEAKSLTLIVDDPDAPDPQAPKMTWVHWVLFNLPPETAGLPEGVQTLPPGAGVGMNGSGVAAYGGPCPPIGTHRYYFKLYAVDKRLRVFPSPTKDDVLKAMEGHVIEQATLMGLYSLAHHPR